jgi:hypothetical protein
MAARRAAVYRQLSSSATSASGKDKGTACMQMDDCTKAGEVCTAQRVCGRRTCSADADCRGLSDLPVACKEGACARTWCETDADCPRHYACSVRADCRPTFGNCSSGTDCECSSRTLTCNDGVL